MKKIFIIKKSQLKEYVETKKAEKVFYEIVEKLHENNKFLSENLSKDKVNKTIIEDYKRKGLINSRVENLLSKYKIIN
jgi:hypothetical protein